MAWRRIGAQWEGEGAGDAVKRSVKDAKWNEREDRPGRAERKLSARSSVERAGGRVGARRPHAEATQRRIRFNDDRDTNISFFFSFLTRRQKGPARPAQIDRPSHCLNVLSSASGLRSCSLQPAL